MITTELTVKEARGLLLLAPKNDVRYYLNGVLIDATESRAVATDGHAMLAVNIATECSDEGGAIIDRALLDTAAKGGKTDDVLHISIDDGDCTIKRSNGQAVQGRVVDGTFPEYWRMIPTDASGELAQFNPELVARAAKALYLATDAPKNAYASLSHNGMGAALLTCGRSDKAIAVVMPYRAPDVDAAVEFIKFKDREG